MYVGGGRRVGGESRLNIRKSRATALKMKERKTIKGEVSAKRAVMKSSVYDNERASLYEQKGRWRENTCYSSTGEG